MSAIGRLPHFSRRRGPVAVVDGLDVWIYPQYPFSSVPAVECLQAITDVEGEYRLDSRALGLITPDAMYKDF